MKDYEDDPAKLLMDATFKALLRKRIHDRACRCDECLDAQYEAMRERQDEIIESEREE